MSVHQKAHSGGRCLLIVDRPTLNAPPPPPRPSHVAVLIINAPRSVITTGSYRPVVTLPEWENDQHCKNRETSQDLKCIKLPFRNVRP